MRQLDRPDLRGFVPRQKPSEFRLVLKLTRPENHSLERRKAFLPGGWIFLSTRGRILISANEQANQPSASTRNRLRQTPNNNKRLLCKQQLITPAATTPPKSTTSKSAGTAWSPSTNCSTAAPRATTCAATSPATPATPAQPGPPAEAGQAAQTAAAQAAKAAASQLELAAQEAGVIEKKKSSQPVRGTGAWDDAMIKAHGQAERYVRALPASEPNPPFLLVVGCGFDQAPDETGFDPYPKRWRGLGCSTKAPHSDLPPLLLRALNPD